MTNSGEYFKHLLEELRGRLEKTKLELKELPDGVLQIEHRGGKPFYIQAIKENETIDKDIIDKPVEYVARERTKRRAINKKPKMIRSLFRKAYLDEEVKLLERDIKALEILMRSYREASPNDILQRMPKRFQKFPPEYFFPQQIEEGWENEPYEQSDYMTERKIHMTSRGLSVRSKSELSISEEFYKFEIPFRYEQVLRIGEYQIAPDFMPRNKRTGQQFYWEHCGMPGNEEYMKHHKWKMNLYESVGIVPWKNLIVTYDGEEGTLNLAEIESVIRNKLL